MLFLKLSFCEIIKAVDLALSALRQPQFRISYMYTDALVAAQKLENSFSGKP